MRISRDMVFYVALLTGIGTYCLLVALAGRWLHTRAGGSGNAVQACFFLAALALLVWTTCCSSLVRRLRVFIATHFFPYKYDYRVEWLRFVQMLATADDPDLRRTAINAVARIFGSPGGALLLRNEARDRYVLSASWPESLGSMARMTLSANEDLVRFMTDSQWVVDLREYEHHPERYDHISLPAPLARASPWRTIAPLFVGRELIGLLLLRSPPDPFSMTFEDHDLLKTVGRHVAVNLAQRDAVEMLAESRQFDAFNRFAAFVMHDLKNSVAQLQLLVSNAARHRRDPDFVDDAIGTIANTVGRMTGLIDQLQRRGETHSSEREIDFSAGVRAAIARAQARRPDVAARTTLPQVTVRADPDRLASLFDHLVRNAVDATSGNGGAVWFEMATSEGWVNLTVADEGVGMDEEFVQTRLFRPFDSTKGSRGMGIGAFQVREYVRSVGGDVDVQSASGRGTRFCIRLPTCQSKNPDC